METKLRRLVMIGSTGTGKSASCNSLCGSTDKYPASAKASSMTFETAIHQVKWFGHDEEEFLLVDTPGLGDTDNRDAQHIENMV
jgi:predicted GTPase